MSETYPPAPGSGWTPPAAGRPGYGGQPGGHPGYGGQPGAHRGRGAHQGQPGRPPDPSGHARAPQPPTRKKRTALKVVLGVLGALMLVCAIGGLALVQPIIKEYPSTLDNPDQVAGLTKLEDPQLQRLIDQLTAQLRSSVDTTETVAAVYAPNGDRTRMVMLFAGTKLVLDPGKVLDSAFRGFTKGAGPSLSDVHDVPPGPLGGVTRCGSSTLLAGGTTLPLAGCAWADHGSFGMVFFFNRPAAESEKLFGQVRAAVLHRG